MAVVKQKRQVRQKTEEASHGHRKPYGFTGEELMALDLKGEEAIWYGELVAELIAREKQRCEDVVKEKKAAVPS